MALQIHYKSVLSTSLRSSNIWNKPAIQIYRYIWNASVINLLGQAQYSGSGGLICVRFLFYFFTFFFTFESVVLGNIIHISTGFFFFKDFSSDFSKGSEGRSYCSVSAHHDYGSNWAVLNLCSDSFSKYISCLHIIL